MDTIDYYALKIRLSQQINEAKENKLNCDIQNIPILVNEAKYILSQLDQKTHGNN
jgi:hypothetical protein